jgi:hypothetical protein
MASAPSVRWLAAELGVTHGMLLKWRGAYEAGGAEALNLPGQRGGVEVPVRAAEGTGEVAEDALAAARRRIAELERKVGQQQLDLDFFRAALQHVGARTPRSGGRIEKASTR